MSYETQSGARAYLLIDSLLGRRRPWFYLLTPRGRGGGVENGTPLHEGEGHLPLPSGPGRLLPCWTCTCSRRCADLHSRRRTCPKRKTASPWHHIGTNRHEEGVHLRPRHRRAEVGGEVVTVACGVPVPVGGAEIYLLTPPSRSRPSANHLLTYPQVLVRHRLT